ncbi:MAG: hypothetical protein U0904_06825 [Candidatus Nanopelagicales bacterium]|nr:hypothetical protein [Candidatus Nanopelagicales bacterium]
MSAESTQRAALALVMWAAVSVLLVVMQAPVWLRMPVVGLFSLLGVGFATLLVVRIRTVALAIAVVVSVGLASLILCSLIVLYARESSGLGTLVLQAVIVWATSVWVLRRGAAREAAR